MLSSRLSFEGLATQDYWPSPTMNPIRTQGQAYQDIPAAHQYMSLSGPQVPLNMNGRGYEYPGGRRNQGQPFQDRARDQGSFVGYGRQSRNSDCDDMASIHDNREEDSIYPPYNPTQSPPKHPYFSAETFARGQYIPRQEGSNYPSCNPDQSPPRHPYYSVETSARDQYVFKTPDQYKLSRKTFPKATPIDHQHHNSVGYAIPSQPLQSGYPNQSGTHRLRQWNSQSISPSRRIDPSLVEEYPFMATSHQNDQQWIGHRSNIGTSMQGSISSHLPNTTERSGEGYRLRRISSREPLHVEKKSGADGKSTDFVRFINGQMEYREANKGIWKPAVYHEEIRDTLIAEASLLGVYDHPRERGLAANDVTSFLPSQKEWGPDRDTDWPKIENNVLHRFERDNYPVPEYKPTLLYHQGRVVLDAENHPILDYKVLPATLSSELSGRDMEAMKRLDFRISRKDFRARMPKTILKRGDGNALVERPLYTLSAIGMRTGRFRKENGLISWTEREGTDSIRSYATKLMPQSNLTANSTLGMSAPTLFEQEDSRTSNRGKYLARAGRHALPDDTRKERARKEDQRLQRLYADHIEGSALSESRNGSNRKRKGVLPRDEKEPKRVKRMRENSDFPASLSTSAPALPSPYMPVAQAPPRCEADVYKVLPKTNRKRSREEASMNGGQDLQGPTKRHKAAHTADDQLMTRSISRSKASPRPVHRRAGRSDGGLAAGHGFSGTASTITPTSLVDPAIQVESHQIRQHHVGESGFAGSVDFGVEVSDSQNQAVDINPALPVAGDYIQETPDFVDSNPPPVDSQPTVPESVDDWFELFFDTDASYGV